VAGTPSDPVDRLLSRSLRERRGETAEVCPDADRLAAWAEGVLDAKEAMAVEAHASSCARCAQILSAVAASDPGPSKDARPGFWAWRAWRWAVPMVTAVVVMGLWFGSTRPEVTRSTAPQQADYAGPASAAAPDRERASRDEAIAAPEAKGVPVNLPPPTVARQPAAPPAAARQGTGSPTAAVAAAPPGPPPSAAAPEFSPTPPALARVEERQAKVEQAPTPPARADGADAREVAAGASARAPAAAPAATRPEVADADRSRQQESPRDAAGARAESAASAFRVAAPAPLVRSPDPNTQWRVRGTAIERTTDAGATWRAEYTSASAIVGGVAVSPEVAWFFGRGGLVLRRTPAGWLVSRLPGDAEIATISATSATEAVVTLAAGGRQLRTTDGGNTWR
jgi:hypothetical protein